jgi:type II secretory pathway pseudopilin PulG
MNGEETNGMLRIVIGIIALVVVAGVVFFALRMGKQSVGNAIEDANSVNTAMSEAKYTDYDGAVVQGSEVIACINNWSNNYVCVDVDGKQFIQTGSGSGSGFDLSGTASTAKAVSSREAADGSAKIYISPSAKYTGEVFRTTDGTNEISCVKFTIVK